MPYRRKRKVKHEVWIAGRKIPKTNSWVYFWLLVVILSIAGLFYILFIQYDVGIK